MNLIFSGKVCNYAGTVALSRSKTVWSSLCRYTTVQITPNVVTPLINKGVPCTYARCCLSTSTTNLLPLPDDVENVVHVKSFKASVNDGPDSEEQTCPVTGLEFVHIDLTCFKSSACVHLPAIPEGEEWQVGYVQGLKKAIISDHYGFTGTSRTLIPELDSGKQEMVADSEGGQYTWYAIEAMTSRKGPAKPQFLTVKMFDTPGSNSYTDNRRFIDEPEAPVVQRVWCGLNRLFGGRVGYLPQVTEESPLTHVSKHLEFCAWLVIRCANTGEYEALVSAEWKVILNMEYDITKPQGERITHMLGNGIQEQPFIRQHNPRDLPDCVLSPPCANEAFAVVWSPFNRDIPEKLLARPKWKPDYQLA